MKRKTLSKKEIKELNAEISGYGFEFDKKNAVAIEEDEKHKIVKSDNAICFFYQDNQIIPSLKMILDGKVMLKKITVDMGAVKFVVNGADIMRPGIVGIEEGIEKDNIIVIIDVNNKKPLAIGKAMYSSEEMESIEEGKVIKSLHFIGDKIWEL